ncbi:MAG: histidine phosphatase family protein [Anaerolineae bacterium]|nr:histidine phosphatase family protein [Anaerolineae bacterium]
MQTTLTLVRHGHTLWNGMGRYQGHAPTPLSERGQAQAGYLARAIAGDETITALYSSDLLRCRQTVAPLADALGLPVVYDARFRETDYGHWQGLSRDEIAAYDPVHNDAFRADPFYVIIPGGESYGQVAARVLAGLDDVLVAHSGEHVLLVLHGGPIREILRHFDLWGGGLPSGNASRTVLAVVSGGRAAALRVASDVSHLPPELRPDADGIAFLTA